MDNDPFYRMTPLEVATGWVGGQDPPPVKPSEIPDHPLDALRNILVPALEREPCTVAFSGGRDSSAILAVAVEVARREGLPLPVPVTNVFPDAPETDEQAWQELVIRHLGLTEWERLVYHDDADLLGPSATRSLRQNGLLWPPTIHLNEKLWQAASGGTLITGEGGDEVFGMRRITPLTGLLRREVHPRKVAARMAAAALAPEPIRRRAIKATLEQHAARPWLRPATQAVWFESVLADTAAEPLRWDRSIVSLLRRRGMRTGLHNLRIAAEMRQVDYVHPLLESKFVHSWAAFGGRLGMPGRTASTKALFGTLLPNEVIGRESKIFFAGVRVGAPSRDFIDGWKGEGVDSETIDVERLREQWTAEQPHAGSLVLLQAAWLASAS